MNVDTSEFRAITGRLEQLEAEFAALKTTVPVLTLFYDAGRADGFGAGVESVLGRPPAPRQRHLQALPGGAR
jgi:hypothetical protein